ncbi:MAG: hypothetical protein WB037_01610, partial [Pseudolabrys sp.]
WTAPLNVVRFTQPPYGTLDAAERAPSTASLADICSAKIRFTPKRGHSRMTCAKKVEPLLPQSGSLDGNHSLWH